MMQRRDYVNAMVILLIASAIAFPTIYLVNKYANLDCKYYKTAPFYMTPSRCDK